MPILHIHLPWGKKAKSGQDGQQKKTNGKLEEPGVGTLLAAERLKEERKRHDEELSEVAILLAKAKLINEGKDQPQ